MAVLGIRAIYPQKNTSRREPGHEIYPYLLRGKEITGPDQAGCADITCIPMRHGFIYLVAVMDWWSRYVLAWRLSNTLSRCARLRGEDKTTCFSIDHTLEF